MIKEIRHLQFSKLIYWIGVLIFFAKPFIGFCTVNPSHPPLRSNILVKVFSKRKQESDENSEHSLINIQKGMEDAGGTMMLRFGFLLAIIFPLSFSWIYRHKGSYQYNNNAFQYAQPTFLVNGSLLI